MVTLSRSLAQKRLDLGQKPRLLPTADCAGSFGFHVWRKLREGFCTSAVQLISSGCVFFFFFSRHLSFLLLNAVSQPAPEPWLCKHCSWLVPELFKYGDISARLQPHSPVYFLFFATVSSLLTYSVTEVTAAGGQKGWKQVLNFNLSLTPRRVPH